MLGSVGSYPRSSSSPSRSAGGRPELPLRLLQSAGSSCRWGDLPSASPSEAPPEVCRFSALPAAPASGGCPTAPLQWLTHPQLPEQTLLAVDAIFAFPTAVSKTFGHCAFSPRVLLFLLPVDALPHGRPRRPPQSSAGRCLCGRQQPLLPATHAGPPPTLPVLGGCGGSGRCAPAAGRAHRGWYSRSSGSPR